MESRESQRDKRIAAVLNDKKSPGTAALRAREELQGIEAERAQNLERQKVEMNSRRQQVNTMREAALIGASGMAGATATQAPVAAVRQQAANMNAQTQALLKKYGINPSQKQVSARTTKSNSQQQTAGPNNIRTVNNTTTNNNTRNEIKIVQPQIPIRQQTIPMRAPDNNGKGSELNKFKAWLDSSFAKQQNDYDIRQKEYRKREWNLARNSSKLFQKLSESTKSLGEKMDPRRMGSSLGTQLKTLLFIFLATTMDKWWKPLMRKFAEIEAGFKTVFGIPISADLQKGGAKGYEFANKIREFIGIKDEPGGKKKSLLGGLNDIISSGVQRLIDTLKVFMEDRKVALQKISMPKTELPDLGNPLSNALGKAFKNVLNPAIGYLGDILAAITGGSAGLANRAARNVNKQAEKNFKHQQGGQYFTSNSTDMFGNLKEDSTYGMSKLIESNLRDGSNTLHTGSIMSGVGMLDRTARNKGSVVVNPQLLAQLGFGPDVLDKLLSTGQAQRVPYKLVRVPKTSAENREYAGGSMLGYAAEGAWDMINPMGLLGASGSTMTMIANSKKVKRGLTRAGFKGLAKGAARTFGWLGLGATAGAGAIEGLINYGKANEGNSGYVLKAVPLSDNRPGTPVSLLRISKEGFDTLKKEANVESFNSSDKKFQTWIEGIERRNKAVMGVKGRLSYEKGSGMEELYNANQAAAVTQARYDEIKHRDDAWGRFSNKVSAGFNSSRNWVANKLDLMSANMTGNQNYKRANTIKNLYSCLKSALDLKRKDLPEDRREAFARLMAAQAMHESGNGESELSRKANNYGGVIAYGNRQKYRLNGTDWARFDSMQDWANAEVDLLGGKRYNAFDKDPTEFVSTLKQGGYFGSESEESYLGKVQKHLSAVNGVVGVGNYTTFQPQSYMTDVSPIQSYNLGSDMSGAILKGVSEDSIKHPQLKQIIAARNTGKFYGSSRKLPLGWHMLGHENYRSACTAGPSTWYEKGGIDIRYKWWDGGPSKTKICRLGEAGFKKVWNGTLAQIDQLGASQLRPGDIGALFGNHADGSPSAHGMMWDGKTWASDTVQDHASCYKNRGRLGNQSAQIWRYPGFWSDEAGGDDDNSAVSGQNTYMTEGGELYTASGPQPGAIGKVKQSAGEAIHKLADLIRPGDIDVKSNAEGTGIDTSSLSSSQLATYKWYKQAGAQEDAAGLYLENKERGIRSYLNLNSPISSTGNIGLENLGAVFHMGPQGTVQSFENDTALADMYKNEMVGKLLTIKVDGKKVPGSIKVDIDLGFFKDIEGFGSSVKRYLKWYNFQGISYNLFEVANDASIYTTILIYPKIPLLDTNGYPITTRGKNANSMYDYENTNGEVKKNWQVLYKPGAFETDSGKKSDLHPYLCNTLHVNITPEALRVIGAVLSFIRGDIDSRDSTISSILKNNRSDLKKELFLLRKETNEIGKQTRLNALGITETSVNQAINNFKNGKNLDNFYLHKEGDVFKVIDNRTGAELGTASDEKGKGFIPYSTKDILNQKNQSTNLSLFDASKGRLKVDASTEYERYKSLYDDINWNDEDYRKQLIEDLQKLGTNKFKVSGVNWKSEIDDKGKRLFNLAKKDYQAAETYIQDKLSESEKKDLVKDIGNIFKTNGTTIDYDTVDQTELKKRLKNISPDIFNKYFSKFGRYNDFDKSSEEKFLKSVSNGLNIKPQDLDELNFKAKRLTSLKRSYMADKSIDREMANALVEKYNREGDSDRLWNSNGILMYKDDFNRVRAYGTVTEDEGGGKFTAKAYSNTKYGAEEFARHNELINQINESSDAAQASREAFYKMKYGAVPIGDGRMYIPLEDGTRLVFSALSKKDGGVGENASLDTIKKSSKLYEYDKDSKKESDGLVGYKEYYKADSRLVNDGMNVITVKDAAIKEIEQKVKDNNKSRGEDKKKKIFEDQFNTSIQNIRNARIADAMNKKGELGETNSILSNIDEQSEQQTNYLKILATTAVQNSGDKNLEKLLSDTNKKGSGLSSIATKEAEYNAVNSKEMVDQITAERLKKKQRLDKIVSDLKKEAVARPNENINTLISRVILRNNGSDIAGVSDWTKDIVNKAREDANVSSNTAKSQSSSPQAPAKTPAKTKEQQKKDKENQKTKEETLAKQKANAETEEGIIETKKKVVDIQEKEINPKLSETIELYRMTGQRIYNGLTNPNSFLGKMINGDSVGFFNPQQTTNNSNTFNAGGTNYFTNNVQINQDGVIKSQKSFSSSTPTSWRSESSSTNDSK